MLATKGRVPVRYGHSPHGEVSVGPDQEFPDGRPRRLGEASEHGLVERRTRAWGAIRLPIMIPPGVMDNFLQKLVYQSSGCPHNF